MAIEVYVKWVDKTSYLGKKSLNIVKGLGNKNSLSLIFNCKANAWMPRVGQDIAVYDGATLLFGGVICSLSMNKMEPMKNSGAYVEVNVSSNGFENICARRTISCYYENKTAGQIFSNILTYVLNNETYNEHITEGNITAENTFANYSAICKNIKEIYDDIASQSGCQWYIDDIKSLNFVSEATVTTAEHTIDVSGAFTDYNILEYSSDIENYCNKVFVKGRNDLIYSSYIDTAEVTERIAIEGTAYSSGIWGKVIEATDVSLAADLAVIGNNELKKYAFEPSEIKIRSFTSSWTCGTKINVYLPEFGMTANQTYMIEELQISRYENDMLAYDMVLSRRKSADFSTQKVDKSKEFWEKLIRGKVGSGGIQTGETGTIGNSQATSTAEITITS